LRKFCLKQLSMQPHASDSFRKGERAYIKANMYLEHDEFEQMSPLFDQAIEYFTDALDAGHHDRFACLEQRASCYWSTDQLGEANADYTMALHDNPGRASARHYYRLGVQNLQNQQFLDAEAAILAAMSYDGADTGATGEELAQNRKLCSREIIAASSAKFQEALLAGEAGLFDQAYEIYTNVLCLIWHPAKSVASQWLQRLGFTEDIADRMTLSLHTKNIHPDKWLVELRKYHASAGLDSLAESVASGVCPDRASRVAVKPRPVRSGISVDIYEVHLERGRCLLHKGQLQAGLRELNLAYHTQHVHLRVDSLVSRCEVRRRLGHTGEAWDDIMEAQQVLLNPSEYGLGLLRTRSTTGNLMDKVTIIAKQLTAELAENSTITIADANFSDESKVTYPISLHLKDSNAVKDQGSGTLIRVTKRYSEIQAWKKQVLKEHKDIKEKTLPNFPSGFKVSKVKIGSKKAEERMLALQEYLQALLVRPEFVGCLVQEVDHSVMRGLFGEEEIRRARDRPLPDIPRLLPRIPRYYRVCVHKIEGDVGFRVNSRCAVEEHTGGLHGWKSAAKVRT
jgi:tetratricopeptide (TPR) repeat protein